MKRLVVNVPPRHLKSLAASVALPAWLLGHDPTLAIVNVTYGQDLSDKFARDCRAIMTSDWYQALFATRLNSPRGRRSRSSRRPRGGFRLATSVGGVLTGRGADVIIIDDPLKPADALSESRRAGANDWFDWTLYPRLNDKQKGAIVIVMQRLHEDDLAGHVLQRRAAGRCCRFRPSPRRTRCMSSRADQGPASVPPRGRRSAERGARAARRRSRASARRSGSTISPASTSSGPRPPAAAWSRRRGSAAFGSPTRPAFDRDRAELGHRQQALRAFRLFRLHHLGPQGLELLSLQRVAQEALLSRAQARRRRAERAVPPAGRS